MANFIHYLKNSLTKNLFVILFLFISGFFHNATFANDSKVIIRLATTTSMVNSGLLDYLLPIFEKNSGFTVHVIAVGTGKALRMGTDGDVDLVLVHAPAAEKKFVSSGSGLKRYPVMYNDFVIVGPKTDPSGLKQANSIEQTFTSLRLKSYPFVSRGDDSGTHKEELSIWCTLTNYPEKKYAHQNTKSNKGSLNAI